MVTRPEVPAPVAARAPLPPVAQPAALAQPPSNRIAAEQRAAIGTPLSAPVPSSAGVRPPLVPVLPARPARLVVTPSLPLRRPTAASASPGAAPAPPSPPLPRVAPIPTAASAAAPRLADAFPHLRPGGARATDPGAAPEGAATPAGFGGGAFGALHAAPIAAAAATRGGAQIASAAPAPPASPAAHPPAPAVDLELLVEKVQRKLLRRLAAERERKGGFG
jgi:hypothetical protein